MPTTQKPNLGIVVPCMNEELVLPESARRLSGKLQSLIDEGNIDADSRIYFVDDGSTDETWARICDLVESSARYVGVKLSRNYGHQYALYAGLMKAEGDALISIDADLQDDINAIDEMVEHYKAGSEIVFGVRGDRHNDKKFKRWTASLHYWLAGRFGIETIPNHADFRLMSKRAVEMLGMYRETNIYLRGIVPLLGLTSSSVYYVRGIREAGETKYGFRAMLNLSVQGITSFSMAPLRVIALLGMVVFLISMGLGSWALWAKLTGSSVLLDGWASTVIPIYLLGGLQLLAIGVAGEYIGKMYMEVKNRPVYQIEQVFHHQSETELD
ncbi:MAG: glycosyltransferase involved in cell wall biosynthesis [Halioglobus sp.]|jgi:glycosyltransferase involved in cell wall biosynthesis